MKLLLDTHVWLWEAFGIPRLSHAHRQAIERRKRAGDIFVSPISAWEIALLWKKGKIELNDGPELWLAAATAMQGLQVAEFTVRIAAASCMLPEPLHGDPADRFLIATARAMRATLVTYDERILAYAEAGHVDVLR